MNKINPVAELSETWWINILWMMNLITCEKALNPEGYNIEMKYK